MASLVLLDTMICIWAFKKQATKGQEHKLLQAERFLSYLDDEGFQVGISAVTLSELLVAVPDSQRDALARAIAESVTVYSFDVPSAVEAARLFEKWKSSGEPGHRHVIKADCQIAGTAIAHGASYLFTEDNQIQKIAGTAIKAVPMPESAQQELF